MSPASIRLKPFAVHRMRSNPSVLIFGPKRSGKSTLKTYLLYKMSQMQPINVGVCLHGTRDGLDAMARMVPPSLNRIYTLETFKNCWNTITKNEGEIKKNDIHVLVDLDDCTFDKKLLRSKEMREMVMNGRHPNAIPVICMQYCMDMGPEIRTNIDYVFVTKQTRHDIKEKMWRYFFGVIPKFEDFCKILDACTQNYEVLVFDATVTESSKPEDCLFYFKAVPNEIPADFKLFDEKYWAFDAQLMQHKAEEKRKLVADVTGGAASGGGGTSGISSSSALNKQETGGSNTNTTILTDDSTVYKDISVH